MRSRIKDARFSVVGMRAWKAGWSKLMNVWSNSPLTSFRIRSSSLIFMTMPVSEGSQWRVRPHVHQLRPPSLQDTVELFNIHDHASIWLDLTPERHTEQIVVSVAIRTHALAKGAAVLLV